MVERNLAKVDVAGSNPVSRSVPRQRDRGRRQSRRATVVLFLFYDNPAAPIPPGGGVFFYRGWESRRRTQVAKGEVCKTSMHRFESDRRLSLCTCTQRSATDGPLRVLHGVFDLLFPHEYFTLFRQRLVPRHVASCREHRATTSRSPGNGRSARCRDGTRAGVAELVDALDLKSIGLQGPCRFKSGPRYEQHDEVVACGSRAVSSVG